MKQWINADYESVEVTLIGDGWARSLVQLGNEKPEKQRVHHDRALRLAARPSPLLQRRFERLA
jgi:hypothetical protein